MAVAADGASPRSGDAPEPEFDFYTVRTPEMVEFSFQLAGPGSRFLAWVIDTLIMGAILLGLGFVTVILGCGLASFFADLGMAAVALFLVAQFVVTYFYSIYFEMRWNGQTPGKKALGIRVLGESGLRLTLYQSMTRNLLRVVDGMPAVLFLLPSYSVGLFAMLVTTRTQRLGDFFAGTLVIREEKRTLPSELNLPQAKYNTLLQDASLPRRLGRVLEPEERELLVEVVQRRDQLGLEPRARLFKTLAEHFREKLGMSETQNFLSDEKWVLNLTQAILEYEQTLLAARGIRD